MNPVDFDESNGRLSPPAGGDRNGAGSIAAWQGAAPMDVPVTISCWSLTSAELEEVNRTGRIWLTIMGRTVPPVWMTTTNPFVEAKEDQGQ